MRPATCLIQACIAFAFVCTSPGFAQQPVAEFSASAGVITPPFVLTNGFVVQAYQSDVAKGGKAVYTFTVPSRGQYVVRLVLEAPHAEANELHLNIDADPATAGMKWEVPAKAGWSTNWVAADPTARYSVFELDAGTHQLIIRGSEPNVKWSSVAVFSRPSPPSAPTGLRIITGQ